MEEPCYWASGEAEQIQYLALPLLRCGKLPSRDLGRYHTDNSVGSCHDKIEGDAGALLVMAVGAVNACGDDLDQRFLRYEILTGSVWKMAGLSSDT